jgi:hypothetical protein
MAQMHQGCEVRRNGAERREIREGRARRRRPAKLEQGADAGEVPAASASPVMRMKAARLVVAAAWLGECFRASRIAILAAGVLPRR